MRIGLIHAVRHSPPPVEAAFAAPWPEAVLMNLLDDSLSADLVRDGTLTPGMTDRLLAPTRYAVGTGVAGVLFTCSAFGPWIEACAAAFPDVPVLKPNEAMIEDATHHGGRVALMASFRGTLASMPGEFPAGMDVEGVYVDGALAALDRGDGAEHDRLTAEAARRARDCDLIVLGQFSLARAAAAVAEVTGRPVLTTPGSAVAKLKALLGQVFSRGVVSDSLRESRNDRFSDMCAPKPTVRFP